MPDAGLRDTDLRETGLREIGLRDSLQDEARPDTSLRDTDRENTRLPDARRRDTGLRDSGPREAGVRGDALADTGAQPDGIELVVLDERLLAWGLPRYQSEMAAAVDLHACIDATLELAPGAPAVLIPAGFALHMGRSGMAALIVPRSGLGHRQGLVVGNLVGVIDADYTGPIMVSAWNRSAPGTPPVTVQPGDRIAQMMFVPVLRPAFAVVGAFSRSTARGAGGFGSTG